MSGYVGKKRKFSSKFGAEKFPPAVLWMRTSIYTMEKHLTV